MYPALINCTSVVYYQQWPGEALESVAKGNLGEIYLEKGEGRGKVEIARFLRFVHEKVSEASKEFELREKRHNYVTPSSFLEGLRVFKGLMARNRVQVEEKTQVYMDDFLI